MPLQTVNLGDSIKPIGIEKMQLTERYPEIAAPISRQWSTAALHYIDGGGYIFCFEGQCCQDHGQARLYVIVPVVHYYLTNPQDWQTYGGPVSLKYLRIGLSSYKGFSEKDKIHGDLSKHDLYIRCTNEDYQNFEIDVLQENRWRTDETLYNQVSELYRNFETLLNGSVARDVDLESYKRIMENATSNNSSSNSRSIPAPSSPPRSALGAPATAPAAALGAAPSAPPAATSTPPAAQATPPATQAAPQTSAAPPAAAPPAASSLPPQTDAPLDTPNVSEDDSRPSAPPSMGTPPPSTPPPAQTGAAPAAEATPSELAGGGSAPPPAGDFNIDDLQM